MEVVVLAIFVLGGDQYPVDTEDAAMKANELAPGRFIWRKYPDQINLEHVRVFLSEAKKTKHGSLMAGGGTKGWRLTPSGVAWASRNADLAVDGSAGRERTDRDLERRRRNEEIRIRSLPAWSKFTAEENVSLREAEAVFRVSEYVRGQRRQQLVDRGCSLFVDDQKLGPFMDAMAKVVTTNRESLDG